MNGSIVKESAANDSAADARVKVAMLFPGQGRPLARVARPFLRYVRAKELLSCASELCGVNLLERIERASADLGRTELYQPTLTALSLGALATVRACGVPCSLVAGHSLGEVAAWSAMGAISAERAVELAVVRGRSMAEAARRTPGGMLALLHADEATAHELVARSAGESILCVAGQNAPDEWVLSGEDAALARVLRDADPSFEARRLDVEGAWHSPMMEPAAATLREAIGKLAVAPAPSADDVPAFVGCASGRLVEPDAIPHHLVRSLTEPLRWVAVQQTLVREGASHFISLAPDGILRALLRRTLGATVQVHEVDEVASLQALAARAA